MKSLIEAIIVIQVKMTQLRIKSIAVGRKKRAYIHLREIEGGRIDRTHKSMECK